ncbi:hypothetical protein [Rufibacter quisquiliarum]|uniref:Uncharacterized protein n=1 Tax=Rufibacter quisquiliarum TaxID=1549639 RepID=A0A839GAR1_9BACT|nr:hypothetical protein [Rufibacter quisquiliarum]MBA9075380.1 hypothetical protein [Rufibacter quisquiliarum]
MALVWGKGGGVTGKVTEYVLMPNGQLSERDAFTRELKDVKTLGQAETLQFFRQMTSLPASFHRPGNMYQYIKLEKEGAVQKEAVWGENRFTPPAEIEALYRQLQSLVL